MKPGSALRTMAAAAGFAAVAAMLAASPARAGSIWAKAQQNRVAPRGYTDDTARQVGDVLTIVIHERSAIDNSTKRNNDKKSERDWTMNGTFAPNTMNKWYGKDSKLTFTAPAVNFASDAESKFEGKSDFTSSRSFTDSITVTVYDVLPNGNLVVMGARERKIDGDTQVINISGIVRVSDITFSNTILSEQVAEFQMFTAIKGPENNWTKPGWLGWLFNLLSPW